MKSTQADNFDSIPIYVILTFFSLLDLIEILFDPFMPRQPCIANFIYVEMSRKQLSHFHICSKLERYYNTILDLFETILFPFDTAVCCHIEDRHLSLITIYKDCFIVLGINGSISKLFSQLSVDLVKSFQMLCRYSTKHG